VNGLPGWTDCVRRDERGRDLRAGRRGSAQRSARAARRTADARRASWRGADQGWPQCGARAAASAQPLLPRRRSSARSSGSPPARGACRRRSASSRRRSAEAAAARMSLALGLPGHDDGAVLAAAHQLLVRVHPEAALVLLGLVAGGAAAVEEGRDVQAVERRVRRVDASGPAACRRAARRAGARPASAGNGPRRQAEPGPHPRGHLVGQEAVAVRDRAPAVPVQTMSPTASGEKDGVGNGRPGRRRLRRGPERGGAGAASQTPPHMWRVTSRPRKPPLQARSQPSKAAANGRGRRDGRGSTRPRSEGGPAAPAGPRAPGGTSARSATGPWTRSGWSLPRNWPRSPCSRPSGEAAGRGTEQGTGPENRHREERRRGPQGAWGAFDRRSGPWGGGRREPGHDGRGPSGEANQQVNRPRACGSAQTLANFARPRASPP
jgi:hypothetical protein